MSGCLCLCCIFRCWCRCVRVSACYFVYSNCILFQLICSMLFDRYDEFGFNELKRSFLPAAVYTLKLKTINIFRNYSISQFYAHALAFKYVHVLCVPPLSSFIVFFFFTCLKSFEHTFKCNIETLFYDYIKYTSLNRNVQIKR